MRRGLASLAVLFLFAHLFSLPPTLEDIDSVNFALGVQDFDVARHQPHPPGYPVYIGLAKLSTAVVNTVVPGWDRDRRAAAGLALWSVVFGAIAVLVVTDFWRALGQPPGLAIVAATVAVTVPLFWFTAERPLTDVPGLVAAIAVQTWCLRGFTALRTGTATRLPVGRSRISPAHGSQRSNTWCRRPVPRVSVRNSVRNPISPRAGTR